MHRGLDSREKSSEWPQFSAPTRGPDGIASRNDRRTVTTPHLGGLHAGITDFQNKLGTVSASATPHMQQHTPGISRRSSPLGVTTQFIKAPGTPQSNPEVQPLSNRLTQTTSDGSISASDLSASLSRISPSQYDSPLTFGGSSQSLEDSIQNQYDVDSIYLNNQSMENGRLNSYSFESNSRLNSAGGAGGSTALYHHHGSRYGLGMGGRINGPDNKVNGLHGPKHKRGDIERE